MEETYEYNVKNPVELIALDAAADSLCKHKEASGIPTDHKLIDTSKKAPYMVIISTLEQCTPEAYCPIWKSIASSTSAKNATPTSMDSWLNRMNLEIKSWEKPQPGSATRQPTHVTMNNGRFHIPDKDEAEFLRWYALSVSLNKRLWFVEQLTPVFRYFVDLDFAQLVGIPERAIEATAKTVQLTLRNFFPSLNDNDETVMTSNGETRNSKPEDALRAIVCTTNYKYIKAKDGKPEMVKTGVHILWPNIFLTRDDALDIRESLVVQLEQEFGKRVHPLNSWQDVVDSSVYGSGNSGTKGSGLRMVGSRKTDICNDCKGKKKKANEGRCNTCLGNGRLDTGRPYFPMCVLDTYSNRDHVAEEYYRQNIHALIVETKTRTTFTSRPEYPSFIVPEHAPKHLSSSNRKRGRTSLAEKDANAGIIKPLDSSLKTSTKHELRNSEPEWDLILSIVRGLGKYKDVTLSKITMNSKKSQYVVHVSGEMCRYCHNVKREHISNRIYFVIDASGIAQRCHDGATEPTDDMQYGLCKDYVGLLGRIPQSLVAQLFPSCSAAKTLISIAKIDDDEIGEMGMRRITNDRKMRKLFQIGDALCQELFKMNWSETLRTSNGEHVIARQQQMIHSSRSAALAVGDDRYKSDQYVLNPSALGSRGILALKELGLDDGELKSEEICDDARQRVTPLAKLTSQLFNDLDFGVELAASLKLDQLPYGDDMGCFDALLSLKLLISENKPKSLRILRDA